MMKYVKKLYEQQVNYECTNVEAIGGVVVGEITRIENASFENTLFNTCFFVGSWGSHVENCTFYNCAFSREIKKLTYKNCTFIKCEFHNCEFIESSMINCQYVDCKLPSKNYGLLWIDSNYEFDYGHVQAYFSTKYKTNIKSDFSLYTNEVEEYDEIST